MTTRLDDRHIRDEPSVLDADMTRDDLVWTLQHLNFGRNNRTDRRQLAHICVDRGVRDFILRAITVAVTDRRFPPPWSVEDYPIGARRRIERSQTAGKGDQDG